MLTLVNSVRPLLDTFHRAKSACGRKPKYDRRAWDALQHHAESVEEQRPRQRFLTEAVLTRIEQLLLAQGGEVTSAADDLTVAELLARGDRYETGAVR